MNKLKNRYIELSKNKSRKRRSYKTEELNAIKKLIKANPEKTDLKLARIFNKNSTFGKRSVRSLYIKIGRLRNTSNISNSQNLTVNQNNLPQQNQNVSEQHDNFFQFNNDNLLQSNNDNLLQSDYIPESENNNFDFDNFYL